MFGHNAEYCENTHLIGIAVSNPAAALIFFFFFFGRSQVLSLNSQVTIACAGFSCRLLTLILGLQTLYDVTPHKKMSEWISMVEADDSAPWAFGLREDGNQP